jgi:hypothetical protein
VSGSAGAATCTATIAIVNPEGETIVKAAVSSGPINAMSVLTVDDLAYCPR